MTESMTTVERQARLLAAALGCERLEPFTEGGESRTFRVAGTDLLASVPRTWPDGSEDPGEFAGRAELLRRIGRRVSVPVPEVVRVEPEAACTVVRLLPGVPLLGLPEQRRRSAAVAVAGALGGMLADLHTWDRAAYADLAPLDEQDPVEWRDETAATAGDVAPVLTGDQVAQLRRFLAGPVPAATDRWVLSHNDLGIEHVLVDGADPAVTGVVDWDDAAVTDPAYDFGLLLRDLGPAALDAALAGYRAAGGDPAGITERASFYAACKLVEDLAFGLDEDRPEYVEKSLAAWGRTFSP